SENRSPASSDFVSALESRHQTAGLDPDARDIHLSGALLSVLRIGPNVAQSLHQKLIPDPAPRAQHLAPRHEPRAVPSECWCDKLLPRDQPASAPAFARESFARFRAGSRCSALHRICPPFSGYLPKTIP